MATVLPTRFELLPALKNFDELLFTRCVSDEDFAHRRELEQLPSYLRGAYFELSELETVRRNIVAFTNKFPGQIHFGIGPDYDDLVRVHTDSFLFNLRRGFD